MAASDYATQFLLALKTAKMLFVYMKSSILNIKKANFIELEINWG